MKSYPTHPANFELRGAILRACTDRPELDQYKKLSIAWSDTKIYEIARRVNEPGDDAIRLAVSMAFERPLSTYSEFFGEELDIS